MKRKIFVGVLLGLMLLGVVNIAFSQEQTRPQSRERFVLRDIQPVGDESNGRVPLMGDDSESDMDGFTTEGGWRAIAFQPVQSFEAPDWKQMKFHKGWGIPVAADGLVHPFRGWCTLFLSKDEGLCSHSFQNEGIRGLCVSFAELGYRWNIVWEKKPGYYFLLTFWPLWLGHGVEHVIQGKLTLVGHTFESDDAYPLTFKLVKERGYVYLCGRGTVTTPDGKIHRLGYDDTVDTWLPRLKSEDLLDREGAAQALGWLAKEKEKDKVGPALIEALKDKAMEVRRNAAEALGRLQDERATEALVPLLKDREVEWWVADVAAESLCRIGKKLKPETVAQIATSLKSDEARERACAVQALGVGGKAAVEPLIVALADKEASVKAAAVQSLITIGDLKGMGEALKAVQEDEVRRSISDWALRLEMNRDNVLKFLNDALRETDKNVRTWSAQKLGEIGDKGAVELLKEALAKEQDAETKKAIEEAVGKLEK